MPRFMALAFLGVVAGFFQKLVVRAGPVYLATVQ